jgi:hypothetical protein
MMHSQQNIYFFFLNLLVHLFSDHVISTGLQMMNLVSNLEYVFVVIMFFNCSQVLKFGAPSRYYKSALTQKRDNFE